MICQPLPCGKNALAEACVGGPPPFHERGGVVLEGLTALHDFDPVVHVPGRGDFDGQPEPVKELRAEIAFLRVAGANQHEPGGVAHREAIAFNDIFARLRHIEEEIDDVIFKEVHFVDVEIPAVGLRQ